MNQGTRTTRGVLLGDRLHRPLRTDLVPSREAGYGGISGSLCGRFTGIVYDEGWVRGHWPDVEMCKWCARG